MHTKSQSYPLVLTVMGLAIAVSLFGATLAKADTVPTVSVTILNASNSTTTSAQSGSLVHANTVVASTTGSTTPSGTASFMLYTTQNCTGASTTQSVGLVGGVAISVATTVSASGLSYRVHYGGNINYPAADSTCTGLMATSSDTISGTVFNDQNKNDIQDGSEPGLSGWTIWLHTGNQKYNSPISASAVTDSNGNYTFWNLATGTYFVEEQEQSGWNQTSSDMAVTLDAAHTSGDIDFANVMKDGNATSTDHGHGNGGGSGDNHNDDMSTTTDQWHGMTGGDNNHGNGTTTDQGHGYSDNRDNAGGDGKSNQDTHTGHQHYSTSPAVTDHSHNNDDNGRGGRNHHGNH